MRHGGDLLSFGDSLRPATAAGPDVAQAQVSRPPLWKLARLRIGNPRDGSARQSRNQRSAAVSAGPAAAGRKGRRVWSETGTSGGSDALRLVLRTQPRSV